MSCFSSRGQLEFSRPKEMLIEPNDSGSSDNKCKQCDFTTSNVEILRIHMKTHRGRKQTKCKHCEYVSDRSYSVKIHMRTHTGEKPVINCSDCAFTTSYKGALIIHKRLHSGERPYKCIQCESSFTRSYLLKLHMRKHTGEKSVHVQCGQCDFSGPHNRLWAHMRKHTITS